MQAATPSLPLAPVPVGHLTDLSVPGPAAHAFEYAARNFVKLPVVPDSSERWQTVILSAGSLRFGLAAAIFGSFQVVMVPRKMSAIVAPSSLRPDFAPSRLYETVT